MSKLGFFFGVQLSVALVVVDFEQSDSRPPIDVFVCPGTAYDFSILLLLNSSKITRLGVNSFVRVVYHRSFGTIQFTAYRKQTFGLNRYHNPNWPIS